ncbi:MAG TPA: DUF1080 domain-containing protein [Chryseosolibacter sp.]
MKKIAYFLSSAFLASFLMIACTSAQKESTAGQSGDTTAITPNKLTSDEIAQGWQLLFDGETLTGWKRFNHDTIGPLWSVRDGAIVCDGSGLGEGVGTNRGSLHTVKEFGNFDLVLDYKLSPGGNSGIIYHAIEDPKYEFDYETGPEFQLLDDSGWKGDLKDAQKAGSAYDMFPAPASKKLNPAGEWNTARIVYRDGHVEHWLNGEKIIEYEENSADFNARLKESKWKDYPDWGKSPTGVISLQDHGAPVYFRNIKIRAL